MTKILLVGQDRRLLESRAAVLETIGALVAWTGTPISDARLDVEECDVVVLCHSLSKEEAVSVIRDVRELRPEVALVSLTSCLGRIAGVEDRVDHVSQSDPHHLLATIQPLLTPDRGH